MIDAAEDALEAVEERDELAAQEQLDHNKPDHKGDTQS
jgi:hypothetical protein